MKIIVIDNDYPNEQNLYGDVFVHIRVKEYIKIHDCLVISLTAKKNFEYEGVPVRACKSTAEANETIDKFKPDEILVHFVFKNIIEEIIPKTRIPYVIWVHGYEALGWYRRLFNYAAGYFFTRSFVYMVLANGKQLKSLKSLIHDSNSTKQDIIRLTNCDPAKIHVIYVCINNSFKKSAKSFNADEPIILQLGTAANKNIKRLIPALKNIKCKLVIIGKLSDENRKLLKDNNVEGEIHDYRLSEEEVIEQYSKSDILSFVSTLEGFGMPIIEANAIGRVVVTGNITSMPEVAGNAAHYVDPFSIQDINNGFLKVINDHNYREALIEKGYENSARFSPKTIAHQYAALYYKMGLQ